MLDAALALEQAGVSAIVLEAIPNEVAAEVTARVSVPTIGIGAGPACDGQILVSHDMLGPTSGHVPPFVRQYAHLSETISAVVGAYVDDVRAGRFPCAPSRQTTDVAMLESNTTVSGFRAERTQRDDARSVR